MPYSCILRRVVDLIDAANTEGRTALHAACDPVIHCRPDSRNVTNYLSTLRLLLAAGANPCLEDRKGHTPLQLLEQNADFPQVAKEEAVALLEEAMGDPPLAACLVWLRRVVMQKGGVTLREETRMRTRRSAVAEVSEEERRALAFVVGVGWGGGCPKDVFLLLMDMLLTDWGPLRKGLRK